MNAASRLISNTVWNTVGRAMQVAAGLFLTPYVLSRLGLEAFGLWTFSRLFLGYLSFADLGIQLSLVRQIAFAQSEEGIEKVNRIVATSFYFFAGAFLISAPIALLAGPPLIRWAAEMKPGILSPALLEEAVFVLTFTAATLFVSICASVQGSVLTGLQRMDLSNQVSVAFQLVNLAATVAVLETGRGIVALVVVSLGARCAEAAAFHLVSCRAAPGFEMRPSGFSWATWRELYDYAWKVQVSRVSEFLAFTFDRMFVSFAVGMGGLGRFHPAIQIVNQARLIPFLTLSASLPFASELSAQKRRETLIGFYLEGSRYLACAGFALLGFIGAAAPVITRLWLGPGYDDVATWVRIYAVGYLISTPLGVAGLLSQAIGRPGIQARSSLIMAGLNVTLAPAGYWLGGLNGLAAGGSVAIAVSAVWFFWKINAVLGVSKRQVLRRSFLEPALWLLPSALALGLFASSKLTPEMDRGEALVMIAAVSAAYAVICLAAAVKMKLLNVQRRLAELLDEGP